MDREGVRTMGHDHHSAADLHIPRTRLQPNPSKGLLLSHPAHVLKEEKEAQSSEMSSPTPLCVSFLWGDGAGPKLGMG